MVKLPDEFRAALETFRGPLDLLLYLIKKDEIDIFDIPIARILDQYTEYLTLIREIDVNLAGEFLVLASTLMEIKSKMLLPEPPELEEEDLELEDPRLDLVRQLLEYKKYKERSLELERRFELMQRRHRRPRVRFEREDEAEPVLDLGETTAWDLLTAFLKVQKAIGAELPQQIVLEDRPIEHYVVWIERQLREADGPMEFEALFRDARDRYDIIGIFVAILEMARDGLLSVRQPSPYAQIAIELREAPPGQDEAPASRTPLRTEPDADPRPDGPRHAAGLEPDQEAPPCA